MRQQGCKDGCFWTTVSSGTCAKGSLLKSVTASTRSGVSRKTKWSGMGLLAGLSSCSKGQDNSGVAAEEPSGLHQRRELAFGECRPQTPGQ